MIRFITALVASSLLLSAAQAADVSAASVQADIARDGARPVVAKLSSGSGGSWKQVISHISAGREDWLAVAAALRPGVDAGTGEDLTGALANALRKNPAPVLKMIGQDFPLDQICDIPLIEPTAAQIGAWKHSVLDALARVKDPSLADTASACRNAISAIK